MAPAHTVKETGPEVQRLSRFHRYRATTGLRFFLHQGKPPQESDSSYFLRMWELPWIASTHRLRFPSAPGRLVSVLEQWQMWAPVSDLWCWRKEESRCFMQVQRGDGQHLCWIYTVALNNSASKNHWAIIIFRNNEATTLCIGPNRRASWRNKPSRQLKPHKKMPVYRLRGQRKVASCRVVEFFDWGSFTDLEIWKYFIITETYVSLLKQSTTKLLLAKLKFPTMLTFS